MRVENRDDAVGTRGDGGAERELAGEGLALVGGEGDGLIVERADGEVAGRVDVAVGPEEEGDVDGDGAELRGAAVSQRELDAAAVGDALDELEAEGGRGHGAGEVVVGLRDGDRRGTGDGVVGLAGLGVFVVGVDAGDEEELARVEARRELDGFENDVFERVRLDGGELGDGDFCVGERVEDVVGREINFDSRARGGRGVAGVFDMERDGRHGTAGGDGGQVEADPCAGQVGREHRA